jgi:hypothetical protein
MSEVDESMQDRNRTLLEEESAKRVAFYEALINSWINTRMELDKSLLTLSVAGIGFLIGILGQYTGGGVETFILYLLALLSFLICVVSILLVLRQNSTHIEDVVANVSDSSKLLAVLDRVGLFAFILGLTFSSVLGVSIAAKSLLSEGVIMSDNKKSVSVNDSVSGVSKFRPGESELTKSLNGIANLNTASTPAPAKPAPNQEKPK